MESNSLYSDKSKQSIIEIDTDLDYLGIENEEENIGEVEPFNPEQISIDTKVLSMESCLRRLEQGTLILNPDFQRNEVWNEEKKSRLIESLMLKIPIPMFYVSTDEKGNFFVVDGLQRLSTIRNFILGVDYLKSGDPNNPTVPKDQKLKGNGFKLQKLEFWQDTYNKANFNKLPIHIQNRLLETEFTFTIINPGTPEEVKRNIFKRLNTGGEPLTSQEIRNALYTGEITKFLKELTSLDIFKKATSNSVKDNRMEDQELVLRFISFSMRDYIHYPKSNDMDTFLCNTMRIFNLYQIKNFQKIEEDFKLSLIEIREIAKKINSLKNRFIVGMNRAFIIFEEHTFRKSYLHKRRTKINKSLFEVWSVLLSKLTDEEFSNICFNKESFLDDYYELLQNTIFIKSISTDSWKQTGVNNRFEKIIKIINNNK